MPVVDKLYVPNIQLIDLLVTKYYPKSQLRKLLKLFRTNFRGREYKDIDAKFKEVVLKEQAQNHPLKPDNSQEIIKKRKKDLENKSPDGEKRAKEAKNPPTDIMSQAEAIKQYHSRCGR